MRVAVTGASGFLGRHVCRVLRDRGYDVAEIGHKNVDLTDMYDRAGCAQQVLGEARADAIVHLAAVVGGIGANQKHPAKFWHDNLLMGINVLECAAQLRIKKLVMVGTTCSYPKTPPTIPFVEEELFHGYPEETNAPYGIAKRALFVGAVAYRREFGLNAVTLVPTNLYGPGEHFDLNNSHVIPALIRKMHEAKVSGAETVTLWGTGSPTRDFLYVADAADAIECALRLYDKGEALNLGSGREVSIKQIAAMVKMIVGYHGDIEWDLTKPDGQPRRCLSTFRAESELGWCAKTPLAEGLRRMYNYFLEEVSDGRS